MILVVVGMIITLTPLDFAGAAAAPSSLVGSAVVGTSQVVS